MGATGCPNPQKKGYATKAKADAAMWSLLTRRKTPAAQRDWQRLNTYRCVCGQWHVGHSNRRVV